MYTYDVNAPGTVNQVMNEHSGNFVGVGSLAPGLDHAVVSRPTMCTSVRIMNV